MKTLAAFVLSATVSVHAVSAATVAKDSPASEQAASVAPADDRRPSDIVVTAPHLSGSVIGNIPATVTLDEAAIQALGANSIADIIALLGPQVTGSAGRGGTGPVLLLNGNRISGFSEVRDLPPEAISRVEVLPEAVALKYGYSASQKVINIVLLPHFRVQSGELEDRFATDTLRNDFNTEYQLIRVHPGGRLTFDLQYQIGDPLRESAFGIRSSVPNPPVSVAGNVTATTSGGEIDLALSRLAGARVTVAGVPGSAAGRTPTIADFVPSANNATFTDPSAYRTLLPRTSQFTANAVVSRTVLGGIPLTLNGRIDLFDSDTQLGLPGVSITVPRGNPFSPFANDVVLNRSFVDLGTLHQRVKTVAAHLGGTMAGDAGVWRWTLTSSFDRISTRTITDRGLAATALDARLRAGDPSVNPFGTLAPGLLVVAPPTTARSTSAVGIIDALITGSAAQLPAGPLGVSAHLGGEIDRFDSVTSNGTALVSGSTPREIVSGQLSVDLPIASRREGVLAGLGELSINGNFRLDKLSDVGQLSTRGLGISWSPVEPLSLTASTTREQAAPSALQLGGPRIETPGIRVFDPSRGETAIVTRVTGGFAGLTPEQRQTLRAEAKLKPFPKFNLSVTASYTDSNTTNPISTFPALSPAIEGAFPGRISRDASGRINAVDARAVNFAREVRRELRWGLTYSKAGQAVGPKVPGGGSFGGGHYYGAGGTSLNLSLYHTWRFADRITIRDGVPVLDLLNGSASGNTGGVPRHEVELQMSGTQNGIGLRSNLVWHGATTVSDGATNAAGVLHFSDLAIFNVRLFYFPAIRAHLPATSWLTGVRFLIVVDNVFDTRVHVRDGTGATPLGYQPGYVDPLGRTLRFSIRKSF